MGLRDRRPGQPLIPIIIMAIGAAEIELALPLHKQLAALGNERRKLRVITGLDRGAARLLCDEGGERQQVAALIGKGARLLAIGAAQIDALLQIDGAAERLVEG